MAAEVLGQLIGMFSLLVLFAAVPALVAMLIRKRWKTMERNGRIVAILAFSFLIFMTYGLVILMTMLGG